MDMAQVLQEVGFGDNALYDLIIFILGKKMLKKIKKLIPEKIKKRIERLLAKLKFFGFARFCPLCNSWVRGFDDYGVVSRHDARCPVCYAFERHRFVWPFFKRHTDLFDRTPKKMLHFAPEPRLENNFKKIPSLDYLSADLYDPKAMVKADITDTGFQDESFDFVYCSHVLEHIEDDAKAMCEIYRILKKGGKAVIMVPILAEKTFEDPSVTDPEEREKIFGQWDHVRIYGPDFKDRLIQSNFKVTEFRMDSFFSSRELKKFGLSSISSNIMPIYLCQK